MDGKNLAKHTALAANQHQAEKKYWHDRLAGNPGNTSFPYDYSTIPYTGQQEKNLAEIAVRLDRDLLDTLMKTAKQSHSKIYMILTAALLVLLYKYTGNKDLILAAPISRQKIDTDFINTLLVLRNRLDPGMTFKELLFQVRDCIREAGQNQNYPLETLLHHPNPSLTGADSHNPIYIGVKIVLENIHDPNYIRHVRCGMCFAFREDRGNLELELGYDSRLYEETTVRRIIGHYTAVLKEALVDVERRISQFVISTEAEKTRLLEEFNRTDIPYPREKTLHGLFAGQVDKTPGQIAVTFNNRQLSYKMLAEQSGGQAVVLKEKGVGPGTIVGLAIPTSLELCVGILGILKAGAAYFPIDSQYPAERLDYMWRDSGAAVLLTTPAARAAAKIKTLKEVVYIETGYPGPGEKAGTSPCPGGKPTGSPHRTLAYVIYTSGTTGKPKGVLIEHRGIVNFIYWRIGFYAITAADVTLQMVPVVFDGFAANLYPVLLSGGRIVLLEPARWKDMEYTRSVIRAERVTNFTVVPSLYGMVLQGAGAAGYESLRFVALVGEKTAPRIAEASRRHWPGVLLVNEYGPTENSVGATANREMTPTGVSVIGTPIANNRVFILDENHHLLPLGAQGELCIGGPGLARGYLNNPELTSEKFCLRQPGALFEKTAPGPRKNFLLNHAESSPLTTHHSPFYLTGDLASWQPDGKLRLAGRNDLQVQVKGLRIEPGEIEKHLLDHDDIKEAAVVAREEREGDTLLWAFVVRDQKSEHPAREITGYKEFLASRLPEFMIPGRYVELAAMPLNINGKIDRRALEEMEITGALGTQYVPPRNAAEHKLAEIWQNLLEKEKIGIEENFFNIGGDSIKVIGLLNRINKEFGTGFTAVDLYENETIAKVAAKIEAMKTSDTAKTPGQDQGITAAAKEFDDIKTRFLEGI